METCYDMDESNIQNFMCRVCTSSNLLINIFLNEAHNIAEKIRFCASVQIDEDDDLPHHICTKCFTDLEIAYAFRNRCEDSDIKLRQLVNLNDTEKLSIKSEIAEDEEISNQSQTTYVDIKKDLSDLEFEQVSCEVLEDYKEITETVDNSETETIDDSEKQLSPSQINQEGKTYTCDSCGLVLTRRNDYFAHIKTHGKRRFRCEICNHWSARKASHLIHVHRHLGTMERHPCNLCDKDFSNRGSLQRHILGVHEQIRAFTCDICRKSFAQKTHLQVHEATHIGQQHKCSKCPASYRSRRFLLRHEQYHLPPEERNEKLIFVHKHSVNPKNKPNNKKYVCEYCGKISNNQPTYIIHLRIHKNERPYQCWVCEKAFRSNGLRRKHMKIHTGEKPHKCDICGKCFREKVHLTTHSVTHKQERNHVCPICSQAFKLKSILNSHMKCRHSVCNEKE